MKVVFLDRDGVINVEKNYLYKIEDFEFVDGVIPALKSLKSEGFSFVVITNQAGIGRGYYTEEQYHTLTRYYLDILQREGIEVLKVYFCPHHPLKGVGKYLMDCSCRKPNPGMLLEAQVAFNINMSESIMFGDKVSDIIAGKGAGVGKCYLVRSGHAFSESDSNYADGVYNKLSDYIHVIIEDA
ncbi:D-glycero-beta-D-manno-heptose 1,7-bisphosphate 7-phosphatase [Vibrio cholerae]